MPGFDFRDRPGLERLLEPTGLTVLSDPEPIGDEFGFASERVAAVVSVDGAPTPVVVKAWDVAAHGLGEIEFYSEWSSHLPIRLPACHALEATDEYGLLVLEDLRPFRQGDELEPASTPDAIAIATAIGLAHAATKGAVSDLPEARVRHPHPDDWHDSRRVAYVDRWGLPDHDVVRAIVVHSQVAERIARSMWDGGGDGLMHSDLHLDNVVFRDDGPVILDWARPGWGPAAHDLSSVLFSCTAIRDFDEIIAAHRAVAPTDDDQVHGAILQRLVVATLGTARWMPVTPRQERLTEKDRRRTGEVADWLARRRPDVIDLIGG